MLHALSALTPFTSSYNWSRPFHVATSPSHPQAMNKDVRAKNQDAENPDDGWPPLSPSQVPHRSDNSRPAGDGHHFPNAVSSFGEVRALHPAASHIFCVQKDALEMGQVIPFVVARAADVWSHHHVKMPFSNHSMQTKTRARMYRTEIKRWDVIKGVLGKAKFETSKDLESAIKEYNQKYAHLWNFSGLHEFFKQTQGAERERLLCCVLPGMAKLALRLPELCSKPIPLLRQGNPQAISMSQEQISCLLANAFFCTFPHRNSMYPNSEYSTFPDINFSRLFGNSSPKLSEKLKTIFCYFSQVTESVPIGLVTFQRCCIPESIQWKRSEYKLTQLTVKTDGRIEEDGQGMLQVDFASPLVGGGVLSSGLVQEEIRFLISPELIAARLFTERLDKRECLVVTGSQLYSKYNGYSDSFKWVGAHNDETPRDLFLRRQTEIVAIDAIHFRDPTEQYKLHNLDRELHKAYCGFSNAHRVVPSWTDTPIATGNWGCGAFRGDAKLKALIQIMAAAQARRDVTYFTFGDMGLTDSLREMHTFLRNMDFTVGK
ncbi:poly(ADP-ribose) glycohydrolase-like isoform X2 [Rhincodon typus]|uniref:poly(ADP-ribose) glycohydrolase-like isoform X2 n=2 Tax=Rhincodon typus TaxID=259920 RepID=UPI00202FC3D3|nr:poly(ADP-ribose) glycohydrolase-like isoform X2 [Rhincodon typus]